MHLEYNHTYHNYRLLMYAIIGAQMYYSFVLVTFFYFYTMFSN